MAYDVLGLTGKDQKLQKLNLITGTWKAIVRSAVGHLHQEEWVRCQEFGAYSILNPLIVGAIARGTKTARYGDLGAKLAVESALDEVLMEIHSGNPSFEQVSPPHHLRTEGAAARFFKGILDRVRGALKIQALSNEYSIDDLECTLLIFLATPNWVVAMQIGDSLLVVRSLQGTYQLIFPERVLALPITHPRAVETMRVWMRPQRSSFICAATCGLARVALQVSEQTPFPPFFQPLEDYIREVHSPEEAGEYLGNFLNSDALHARTSSDRTLLLCTYQFPPAAEEFRKDLT